MDTSSSASAPNQEATQKVTKPAIRKPTPPELADVALIDAPRIAAAACMSLTSWFALVRSGEAPQPAFRGPRCTRWRLADVREWLRQRAKQGDDAAADAVMRTARAGSAAAKAKRAAGANISSGDPAQ